MTDGEDRAGGQGDVEETRPLGGGAAEREWGDADQLAGDRGEPVAGAHAGGSPGADDGEPLTMVEAFESELAEAMRRADENWDRYLRAEAELENLRKRAERRREEALHLQRRDMLASCLEVMDNLERALAHGAQDPAAVVEGVESTYRELARALAREGVEQMQALDQPFDPELHEAIGVVPLPAGKAELVVAVDRPGYTLDGELLRPARVLVGQPQHDEGDGEDP